MALDVVHFSRETAPDPVVVIQVEAAVTVVVTAGRVMITHYVGTAGELAKPPWPVHRSARR